MIQPQIHDSELIDPFLSVEVRLRTDLWFSSLLMFVEKLTGALQLRGSVQGKGGLKIHVLPKMTTAIVYCVETCWLW